MYSFLHCNFCDFNQEWLIKDFVKAVSIEILNQIDYQPNKLTPVPLEKIANKLHADVRYITGLRGVTSLSRNSVKPHIIRIDDRQGDSDKHFTLAHELVHILLDPIWKFGENRKFVEHFVHTHRRADILLKPYWDCKTDSGFLRWMFGDFNYGLVESFIEECASYIVLPDDLLVLVFREVHSPLEITGQFLDDISKKLQINMDCLVKRMNEGSEVN
jgi:hypothetical protein